MKIVVIGGNGSPGEFGRDFCDKARSEGHEIYVLSHIDQNYDPIPFDERHVFAEFRNVMGVVNAFNVLTKDIDNIDILLYNSNGWSYPSNLNDFQSTSEYISNGWQEGIRLHAAIPHALSIQALKKMNAGSKVVFVTSSLSFLLDRTFCTEEAGYAGCKGAQNQLMIAFAHHNDRGVVFTSFAPNFVYPQPDKYKQAFDRAYHHVMTVGADLNGKIVEIQPDF